MITTTQNCDKLKHLLLDIFLIPDNEFRLDLKKDEIETWDSLGVVSLAVGIEETFGYHMTQEEAMAIRGVPDIIDLLTKKGIELGD